jgi:hypothetical protein
MERNIISDQRPAEWFFKSSDREKKTLKTMRIAARKAFFFPLLPLLLPVSTHCSRWSP